jgi:hypothetical protein
MINWTDSKHRETERSYRSLVGKDYENGILEVGVREKR